PLTHVTRNLSLLTRSPATDLPARFFFAAEDGIRDLIVTGVQTCALPIFWWRWPPPGPRHQTPKSHWVPPPANPGRRRSSAAMNSASVGYRGLRRPFPGWPRANNSRAGHG